MSLAKDILERANEAIIPIMSGGKQAVEMFGFSKTNRLLNLEMARVNTALRAWNLIFKFDWIEELCQEIEMAQMTINGYTRNQYKDIATTEVKHEKAKEIRDYRSALG